jgi:hypothetical protein
MGDPSRWHKFKVMVWTKIARLLPRDLIYFVLIRVKHEVTADQWPDDESEIPSVSLDSAIGRYNVINIRRDERNTNVHQEDADKR